MSKQRLDCDASTKLSSDSPFLVLAVCFLLLSLCAAANPQSSEAPRQAYIPTELQVTDPDVKALLDSAEKSAKLGNYGEYLISLQKALDLATKQKSIADSGIVEDKIAVYYFTQGKLEDAKSQWLNSLTDGMAGSNLVLQADVLVALSTLQQASGHLDQAMKIVDQALDVSRRSKSLYIESRVLGELSRLQLLAGKQADARASIEEALQIDRFNRYDWEAGHLLGMAWVSVAESKADKAIEFATSARDLAASNENYLTFIQASLFLGQASVHKGQTDKGIRTLELARKGQSEQGKPLFKSPDGYTRTASQPYLTITFLEALGIAYETANRPDDALRSWKELYDTAASASFTLARAEGARHLADLYKVKKEFSKSENYYALAAESFATAGNEQSRIDALTSEEVLLFQQGEKEKALQINEELLPLAKASKNVRLQFYVDLAIAEILDGTGKLDRSESALREAESLVGSDMKVAGVPPSAIVELYIRLTAVYEKQKDILPELIALEKAITPAIALSAGEGEAKNGKPLAGLVPQLEAKIAQNHVRDAAEKTYADGNFANALVYFELLRYFDETRGSLESQIR